MKLSYNRHFIINSNKIEYFKILKKAINLSTSNFRQQKYPNSKKKIKND